MPVDRVREVLAAPDLATRNKLIAEHLGALESKLAQTQAAVATLRGLLQAEPAAIAVELRNVPATRALAIHAVVTRDELVAWWRGALGELEATCDAQQLVRTGAPGGTVRAWRSSSSSAATRRCSFRSPAMRAPSAARRWRRSPRPSSRSRSIAARTTTSTSPMARSVRTSRAHAIGVDGPVRESYLVDPRTPSAGWHTEIGWPVFGVR